MSNNATAGTAQALALNSVTANGVTLTMSQVVQYAPVVHFYSNGSSRESYMPCTIEYLLDKGQLCSVNGTVISSAPTQQTLCDNPASTNYLVIDPSKFTGQGINAPMYVSVQVPSGNQQGGFVDLNFYFLCGYNGPQGVHASTNIDCTLPDLGCHQGDIEGITVRVTCQNSELGDVQWVRYEAHGGSVFYAASDVTWWTDTGLFRTKHPLVYCGFNSHATYPRKQSGFIGVEDFTLGGIGATFGDYVADGQLWIPFEVGPRGTAIPDGRTIFVGLDANGNPIGDQLWAKYQGNIGINLQTNSFTKAVGIGTPLDWRSQKTADFLASQIVKFVPDRTIGDGPVGLGRRPSIQMNQTCWTVWQGTATVVPLNYTGVFTLSAPAAVMVNDTLVLVYVAVGLIPAAGGKLRWATYNGTTWQDRGALNGWAAAQTPALAIYNDGVQMVYADQVNQLHWAVLDPETMTWTDKGAISPTLTCASAPALAAFGDLLYLVYEGTGGKQWLYWATCDRKTWTDRKNLVAYNNGQPGQLATSTGPALAAYNGILYLVYRDSSNNNYIWWASLVSATANWTNLQTVKGQTTICSPSLTAEDGRLFLAYNGNKNIYFSVLETDGASWSQAYKTIAGPSSNDSSSNAPAIVGAGGVGGALMYMVYSDGNPSNVQFFLNTCTGA